MRRVCGLDHGAQECALGCALLGIRACVPALRSPRGLRRAAPLADLSPGVHALPPRSALEDRDCESSDLARCGLLVAPGGSLAPKPCTPATARRCRCLARALHGMARDRSRGG